MINQYIDRTVPNYFNMNSISTARLNKISKSTKDFHKEPTTINHQCRDNSSDSFGNDEHNCENPRTV